MWGIFCNLQLAYFFLSFSLSTKTFFGWHSRVRACVFEGLLNTYAHSLRQIKRENLLFVLCWEIEKAKAFVVVELIATVDKFKSATR